MKHYLPLNADGALFAPDISQVKPGDEIVIKASAAPKYAYIVGLRGTPEAPIKIINEGGVALVGGFDLPDSENVKITGSGDTAVPFGFQLGNDAAGWTWSNSPSIHFHGKSKNCEAEKFKVVKTGYGVWIKNEKFCDLTLEQWVLDNFSIHDFEMTDLNHHGFYVGATEQTNLSRPELCNGVNIYPQPSRLGNIKVFNGKIHNIGKNGVMISDARFGMSEVHDMDIFNTGNQTQPDQGSGISIGGFTNAKVYNNKIKDTWLWNIVSFGAGTIDIYNNVCDGAGVNATSSQGWPQNIRVGDNKELSSVFSIRNNKCARPGSAATHLAVYGIGFSKTGNVIGGNTVIDGGVFTRVIDPETVFSEVAPEPVPTPDPVPDPVPAKTVLKSGYWLIGGKRKYYIAYTDFTWRYK